ncbi:hypothetical protein [Halalkalibacter urbisdiaboli]|uniref:hypothetical protein n=1 Tax=Halalkalibacter urbisdiaboli TaxID=1960589 RepID=UPI000B44AFB6|nr:hypothetical protein [Halalkalibacter urbisdiaboli]
MKIRYILFMILTIVITACNVDNQSNGETEFLTQSDNQTPRQVGIPTIHNNPVNENNAIMIQEASHTSQYFTREEIAQLLPDPVESLSAEEIVQLIPKGTIQLTPEEINLLISEGAPSMMKPEPYYNQKLLLGPIE